MTEYVVVFALSNMDVVCLQGLGVVLQLQLANNIIWNRTLF